MALLSLATHARLGVQERLEEANLVELRQMPEDDTLKFVAVKADVVIIDCDDALVLLRNAHEVDGEVSADIVIHALLGGLALTGLLLHRVVPPNLIVEREHVLFSVIDHLVLL